MTRINLFYPQSLLDVQDVRMLRESKVITRFDKAQVTCVNGESFGLTKEAYAYLKGKHRDAPVHIFTSSAHKPEDHPDTLSAQDTHFVAQHGKSYWTLSPFTLDAILVCDSERHFMLDHTPHLHAPHTRTKKGKLTEWLCPYTVVHVDGHYYNFLRIFYQKIISNHDHAEEVRLYYNKTDYKVIRKSRDIAYSILLFSCGRVFNLMGASSLTLLKKWISDFEQAHKQQPENRHLLFERLDDTCTKWLNGLSSDKAINSERYTIITTILGDMKQAYKEFMQLMNSPKTKTEKYAKSLEEINTVVAHFFDQVAHMDLALRNVIEQAFAKNLGDFDLPPKTVSDTFSQIITFHTGCKQHFVHPFTCYTDKNDWGLAVQKAKEKQIYLPEDNKKVRHKFDQDPGLYKLVKEIYMLRSHKPHLVRSQGYTFKHIQNIRKESLELIDQLHIDTDACINKIYHAVNHPVDNKHLVFEYTTAYNSFKALSQEKQHTLLETLQWTKQQFKEFLCALQNLHKSCLEKYIPIIYDFTLPWHFGIEYSIALGEHFHAIYSTHNNLITANRRIALLYMYHVLHKL